MNDLKPIAPLNPTAPAHKAPERTRRPREPADEGVPAERDGEQPAGGRNDSHTLDEYA
jgi:hypothetical protein